jgi:hypothetical protein
MFFSCRIQSLRMWRAKMWVYLGSSLLFHPCLEDLSVVEVEAQIRKVLDSAIIPSHGAGPDPL